MWDGDFVTVRVQDLRGRAVHFHFRHRIPGWGPPPPRWSKAQWVSALSGGDPVPCLAALVWLTAEHLSSSAPRQHDASQETIEDSRLFESVRDAPETARAIRQLVNSQHPWIREYAQAAGCVVTSR
jgi:hypothetical protein